MKKIIYIALFLLSTFFLVACDDDYSFSIEASAAAVRESITVSYTLNDPEKELSSSEVKADLEKKADSKLVSTKTLTFDKETKQGTVKFSNLESNTEYTLTIYAGYDGDKVVLHTENVKTLEEGASEDKPYEIKTAKDFENIVKHDPNGYFKLMNDIDFGGTSISPLFTSTTQFVGHFDGQGHKLSNYIVGTAKEVDGTTTYTKKSIATDYYGLFGYLGIDSVVTNLTLENFQFHATRASSSKTYYGFIAGYCKGTISKVNVINSVMNIDTTGSISEYHIASIAGQVAGPGVISECNVECMISVNGKNNVKIGGIVASTLTATTHETITKCSYTGDINYVVRNTDGKAKDETLVYIGGIVGVNYLDVKECNAVGEIVVSLEYDNPSKVLEVMVGGLVGWNIGDAAELVNSTADVAISVTSQEKVNEKAKVYAGLLVGQNGNNFASAYAIVDNCHVVENAKNANISLLVYDEVVVEYGVIAVDTAKIEEGRYSTKTEVSAVVEYYHYNKYEQPKEEGVVEIVEKLELVKTTSTVLK